MLRVTFIVVGLVAAGSLTVYVAVASGAEEPAVERETPAPRAERPWQERASRLRQVRRTARQAFTAAEEAPSSVAAPQTVAPPDLQQDEPEARAQALAEDRRRFEALYRSFSAEPVDGAWADRTVARLRARHAAAKLEGVAQIVGIACKTSRCVLDLKYVAPREDRRDRDVGVGRAMQRVLNDWLLGQPCGFHMPGPATLSGAEPVQRVFLDCSGRRAGG